MCGEVCVSVCAYQVEFVYVCCSGGLCLHAYVCVCGWGSGHVLGTSALREMASYVSFTVCGVRFVSCIRMCYACVCVSVWTSNASKSLSMCAFVYLCISLCMCVCVCPVQVTRGTSRPCWERWPALSPLAPAAGASSAAPAPLAHSLASPTPVAGPHFQTTERRGEEAFNKGFIRHTMSKTHIRRCFVRVLDFNEPYPVH